MLYQWSGNEEELLNKILKPLVDACGIVLAPESTRDQALLDTRVKAGTPPDIAFWGTTQLAQYKDKLVPIDQAGGNAANYADYLEGDGECGWQVAGPAGEGGHQDHHLVQPGGVQGQAATQVPTTWDELDALVEKMKADGKVPWSMGMESGDATGWTGSDFIQDIMLVQQGPDYVNGLHQRQGQVQRCGREAGLRDLWQVGQGRQVHGGRREGDASARRSWMRSTRCLPTRRKR